MISGPHPCATSTLRIRGSGLKPGDVVGGVLVGARETKVRLAVVIASVTYLAERPDAVAGLHCIVAWKATAILRGQAPATVKTRLLRVTVTSAAPAPPALRS